MFFCVLCIMETLYFRPISRVPRTKPSLKMGSEGLGECSRKTEGDHSGDDGSGDTERPLKKARYVWQVKGKYHLKDSFNSANKDSSEPPESSSSTPTEKNSDEDLENNLNNNNAPNNNNNVSCNGKCCIIETVLAQADALMVSEDSSDEDNAPKNIDKPILDDTAVTLVAPEYKNQDYYMRKWQARQVAKGYLDNTINRVLECWMVAPCEDSNEISDRDLEDLTGFDSDFVDKCDNDGQVEDEGILMAIQSHGLQPGVQNWGESSSNTDTTENTSTSFARALEIAESTIDNYQNVHNELKRKSTDAESENCNENGDKFENMEMSDHTNFLDAAVAVAIQKKGLTSQNYV